MSYRSPALAFALVSLVPSVAAANPIVVDLVPGIASNGMIAITSSATASYFLTKEGAGTTRLYRSDGRPSGTALLETYPVTSSAPRPVDLVGVSPKGVYFVGEQSDLTLHSGFTGGGVVLGKVPSRFGALVGELANGTGIFLFKSAGQQVNEALIKSDGTAGGTSSIAGAVPLNRRESAATLGAAAFYVRSDGNLMRTDGGAPTVVYAPTGSPLRHANSVSSCGGKLYVVLGSTSGQSLNLLEGASLTPLFETPSFEAATFRCATTKTFFVGKTPATGVEIWVSDGTPAGTHITKDVYPGAAYAITAIGLHTATVVDGRLYFDATDGTHGHEPWTSDGTDLGTVMLSDLAPGSASGDCNWLADRGVGNKAYCATSTKLFEAEATALVERTQAYTAANIPIPYGTEMVTNLGARLLHVGGVNGVTGSGELVVLDTASPYDLDGGVVFPPTGDASAPADGGPGRGDGGARDATTGVDSGGDSGAGDGSTGAPGADADTPSAQPGAADSSGCTCDVARPSTSWLPGWALVAIVALGQWRFRVRARRHRKLTTSHGSSPTR